MGCASEEWGHDEHEAYQPLSFRTPRRGDPANPFWRWKELEIQNGLLAPSMALPLRRSRLQSCKRSPDSVSDEARNGPGMMTRVLAFPDPESESRTPRVPASNHPCAQQVVDVQRAHHASHIVDHQ